MGEGPVFVGGAIPGLLVLRVIGKKYGHSNNQNPSCPMYYLQLPGSPAAWVFVPNSFDDKYQKEKKNEGIWRTVWDKWE